jgi:hypothetical protein
VTSAPLDARVRHEVPTIEKIMEEKGLAVDPVHNSAPKSPPSPNQPPKG